MDGAPVVWSRCSWRQIWGELPSVREHLPGFRPPHPALPASLMIIFSITAYNPFNVEGSWPHHQYRDGAVQLPVGVPGGRAGRHPGALHRLLLHDGLGRVRGHRNQGSVSDSGSDSVLFWNTESESSPGISKQNFNFSSYYDMFWCDI